MRATTVVAAISLFASLLCACASSGSNGVGAVGGGDDQANVRRVVIGSVSVQANGDAPVSAGWQDVKGGITSTWRALPVAYKQLGLTITRYDSVAYIIEGERLHSHAPFGGTALTTVMDCGEVEGMPNAARFDITIGARTVLKGNATSSSVASSVIASAKPDGVAGVYSPCAIKASAAQRVNTAISDAISLNSH